MLKLNHIALWVNDERTPWFKADERHAIGTKPAKTMVEWLEFFERFDEEKYGSDGGPLHDPTAAMYVRKEDLGANGKLKAGYSGVQAYLTGTF